MPERLSLAGDDWRFKDYYGEDWHWRDSFHPETRDTRFWRRGSVPGSVYHDLWKAGEIPDPYFERNSLLIEWVPARTWLYKKTFPVDASLRGKRVQLRFEGVDYEAQFFLNGERLGAHRGMYTPAVFEVSDRLIYGGDNLIAVVIEPAPHEQPQVGRSSRVTTHKSRMTYWWDFCPRMVHLGIWDDVVLEVSGPVRVDDVFVRPLLAPDFSVADVRVMSRLDAAAAQIVRVETTIRFNGEIVGHTTTRQQLVPGVATVEHAIRLEWPRLWWPNGYGEQPLYDIEVRVLPEDDQPLAETAIDWRAARFGVRSIELIPNEGADPKARPYTFVVNGRKVYIKGWNWVPIDVMYGVPRQEKLAHLFDLAKRAHVNLLRVWGGGLIETEAFYNLADELGIMVWQEFIQSSSGIDNNPPTSPEFIDMMVSEATQIIPRRRNHPSLVLWCGGNELTAAGEQPLDDSHPLLGALRDVVHALDPDRHWLPTSPTGPVFSNSLANIERDPQALHDVHGPWEYQGVEQQYALYNRSTSLFHSEFGVEGVTNLKTLNAVIAPEHQWPVSLENPYWEHLGAWWVKEPTWRAAFGELPDVPAVVLATQLMQAEGLRYAVEANRRRKYRNSGSLPWQFNEPYPMAACTSAVDYYGQAKPVYYAVARAYAPVHVSASFETMAWHNRALFEVQVWANSSSSSLDGAILDARLVGPDGVVYAKWRKIVDVVANSVTPLTSLQLPLANIAGRVFFLDLLLRDRDGLIIAANRYPFTRGETLAPFFDIPATELEISAVSGPDAWRLTITNRGENAALWVWLEDRRALGSGGFVRFDDNHFTLLPGETRRIEAHWNNVPVEARELSARGWNTPTYTIP
ncbi:MAG: glycoside hydrolase family 2 protein [Chloroflexota bacterium]